MLHLLIGYIVVRLALGGGGNADQSGALATLGSQTGGAIALWVAAIGLFALALWRLAESVVGSHPNDPTKHDDGAKKQFKRVKSTCAGSHLLRSGAVSAIRFANGAGQSSGQQNAGTSARLMQSGVGQGGTDGHRPGGRSASAAITSTRAPRRSSSTTSRSPADRVLTPIGMTGYIAKGTVLAGAGLLVIVATLRADPAKAAGIDAAVKTLGQAPFGKFLLILAAVGFAAYGAYCFVLARFARM